MSLKQILKGKIVNKPCDETCPKCGGSSVKLLYYNIGDWVENRHKNDPRFPSLVTGEGYNYRAIEEFIRYNCWTCEHVWSGKSL